MLEKNERKVILKDGRLVNFTFLPKTNKCKEIVDQIQLRNSEYIKMEMRETLKSRPINGGLDQLPRVRDNYLKRF